MKGYYLQNVLIVHNKYLNFGGEDSNFDVEVQNLKIKYNVFEYVVKNSNRLYLRDLLNIVFFKNLKVNKDIKKILVQQKIDTVYIHNTWYKINLGIFKILENYEIKVIQKLHNFRFDCIESNHFKNNSICHECSINKRLPGIRNKCYKSSYIKSILITRYSKKFFQILKNNNLKIFVFSKFHKDYLISTGIPEKKIHIQPNFVNLSFKKVSYKPNSDYATLISRLESGKGIFEILDDYLDSNFQAFDLFVIGDGALKNDLIKKYSDFENIKFLGLVEYQKVQIILSNAKFNLFGSKMYEGQPMALMEASAKSVPSIFPIIGGLEDYFPLNYRLKFVNSKNNLKHLLNQIDDDLLIESSNMLENFINKNYSQNNLLKKFSNNYE